VLKLLSVIGGFLTNFFGLVFIVFMRMLSYMPGSLRVISGGALGRVIFFFLRSRSKIIKINLSLCFKSYGQANLKKLYADTVKNLGVGLLESGIGLFRSDKYIISLVNISGFDVVKKHYNNRQPIIILIPHFSHMMLAVRVCGILMPSCLLRRPQNNLAIEKTTVTTVKANFDAMVLQKDARGIIRRLKQKNILLMLPDHDLGANRSVFADFFGVKTATVKSVSKLAKSCQAKVVTVNFSRRDNYNYSINFQDISSNLVLDDYEADAAYINTIFEGYIKQNPSQYYWCHRRFKSRPPGEDNFYS
jgi:lauroyl/myristoyl acyltransferase